MQYFVQNINAFDLLQESQDYAQTYFNTAEDASTNKRFVQHVLTQVINKMNSLMEVSDTQAAAALLGMNAGICSENFSYFDTTGHLAYMWEEKHGSEEMSFCSDLSCKDEDEDDLQSFISK